MNIPFVRKQLEEIKLPDVDMKQQVLQQIRVRRHNRKRRLQLSTALVLLVVVIATVQYQQLTTMAETVYRNIQLSLHQDKAVIHSLSLIPIEVSHLTWIGKKPNRVGQKSYTDINAAEDELQIKLLRNTLSYESAVHFQYFEKRNMASLILHDLFIGDLKNFSETVSENGNRQLSYRADHNTRYQSPVSMKISFFTGSGTAYEMDNLETYHYEEKYISPLNGITAYLLKDTRQATSEENRLLMYAAGNITEKMTVFVHDHLLYTLYGNVPSQEMKEILDAFVVK